MPMFQAQPVTLLYPWACCTIHRTVKATLILSVVTVAPFSSASILYNSLASIIFFSRNLPQCLIFLLAICLCLFSKCLVSLLGSGMWRISHLSSSGMSYSTHLQAPLYRCPAAVAGFLPFFSISINFAFSFYSPSDYLEVTSNIK